MGSSASKETDEKVCIDCDKKTQKDLPTDDSSAASKGNPCEEVYARVGKLAKCVDDKLPASTPPFTLPT